MNPDYLLTSPVAARLYRDFAAELPIIDYHNHLPIAALAENRHYTDIFSMWLAPDPYKHRAMRMCGIPERLITGDASPEEKFTAWCEIFPNLIGSPLHVWSQCELARVFGIDTPICKETALDIMKSADSRLKSSPITPTSLLCDFKTELVCPCAVIDDDISPLDDSTLAVPSLRADSIVSPDSKLIAWLSARYGEIHDLDAYKSAICARLDDFTVAGCVSVDHALDDGFTFAKSDRAHAERAFSRIIDGSADDSDRTLLQNEMLLFLGVEYARRGFTLQLHIGAKRSTSTRLRRLAGAAGGFAAIGTDVNIADLTSLFDSLEHRGGLPKTIVFTLNPSLNAAISVLSGSYSCDGVSGLITQGPAWWWCDHANGIREVLESVSAYGLLANFPGMTTDSRSILSFVRHDYFRRILCSFLAEKLEKNELLCSEAELGALIRAVSYENAKNLIVRKD